MISSYLTQIITCLVFLVVLYFVARMISKNSSLNKKHSGDITIIDTMHIGSKEKVLLMEVDNQRMLVGVTANQISLIKNMDDIKTHEIKN